MFNLRNFTVLALFIGFTTVQADVEEVIVTANKKEAKKHGIKNPIMEIPFEVDF